MTEPIPLALLVDFPKRLATLRDQRKLTQAALAKKAGISLTQIKRYEGGHSQPTLDVLRAMAIALGTSTDALVFGKDTRGPDEDLRLLFEAVTAFSAEEKKVAKVVLEGLVLKHDARKWAS